MKAEDITTSHNQECSWVFVDGHEDSIYYSGDHQSVAEKRRQELIDALPKPRWVIRGGDVLSDGQTNWYGLPKPHLIADLLNAVAP